MTKSTYYSIYNELQIVSVILKMEPNHFISDGYTHLGAQSSTNYMEDTDYVPEETQDKMEHAMEIITGEMGDIDVDEDLFQQSLKIGFASLPSPLAGACNILFQPKAEIEDDTTKTYHDMDVKPQMQQRVEAWVNPYNTETEAQDDTQFNECIQTQNLESDQGTTGNVGNQIPTDVEKYDENAEVHCKLCGEKYPYMHLESHVVGVHGLDGPREMYVDDQRNWARGSTVWPPTNDDVEKPPFNGDMAAHNVPHERELTLAEMMVDYGMQLLPPPLGTETSPPKENAGVATPSSRLLARKKWKLKGTAPKIICILCNQIKTCKDGCENAVRNGGKRLIPIPSSMDKNLYAFENPEKVRRRGPQQMKELLSFTIGPDHLCLGPKKSGVRAPSSEVAWLYALTIEDDKYVIKWATCVNWGYVQRSIKLHPMREVEREFDDIFLETSRQESHTRQEERERKLKYATAKENLENELRKANEKLQQYDNIIKGCLMAFKTLRHIAIDQAKITDPNHRQYVSETDRLANIAMALERTKQIASKEWEGHKDNPAGSSLNKTI